MTPARLLPLSVLLAGLLLGGPATAQTQPALAANAFEGQVVAEVFSRTSGLSRFVYSKKGADLRIDSRTSQGNQPIQIYKTGDAKILVLFNDRQRFSRLPLTAEKTAAAPASDMFESTEETESVAGYSGRHYRTTNENGDETLDIWVTNALFPLVAFDDLLNDSIPAPWHRFCSETGVFPLKMIRRDANGLVLERFEVQRVREGELRPEAFEAPEGFAEFDLSLQIGRTRNP